jgi:isopenicillin N synthase-like dioxygenase
MTEKVDPHVQALRDLLVADHRAMLAEAQKAAAEAASRGDEWFRKFHQDEADRLRAIRFPWEAENEAA